MASKGETRRSASNGSRENKSEMPKPVTMASARDAQEMKKGMVTGMKSCIRRGSTYWTTRPNKTPPIAPIKPSVEVWIK